MFYNGVCALWRIAHALPVARSGSPPTELLRADLLWGIVWHLRRLVRAATGDGWADETL